jgi:NAD(P)-dependent dehydrogenase (short-subunit alcohol dehydrogenase family)
VALAGLEPNLLSDVASDCGRAPWRECNVADRQQVENTVNDLVDSLGGLDIVVANAGIAAQMTVIDGDSTIMERTIAVNTLGVYYTLRAAGPHISHENGYALVTSSVAAAVHLPLMSAYCASKAAVEALADSMRIEVRPTGARVGVAYFGEIDTDMVRRGLQTAAALKFSGNGHFTRVAPISVAVDALEAGLARRSRRVCAPRWVNAILPMRMIAQYVVDAKARSGLDEALRIARIEHAPLTTPQPETAS